MASRTSSVLGAAALLVLALLSTAVNFTEPRKPFVSLAPIRLEETSARLLSGPAAAGQPKTAAPVPARYRLDPSQSKFIAHALAGGLLWFKGHDHLVAVREFTGEAELTSESVNPASLQITAKTASMVETSDVFTEQQKQIIDKELREIVLLPA